MLAEIFARGPIAATVAVPAAFENYTSGVFHDTTGDVKLDHSIGIAGWGVTSEGVKYWISRNTACTGTRRYIVQQEPSNRV